jgi:hypothetical protein
VSLYRAFLAGGIAACGAVTVTHSFETVKIRLQLQGELQAKNEAVKQYKGPLHGVKVILQNEGPRGLFRGIGSAVSAPLDDRQDWHMSTGTNPLGLLSTSTKSC